MSWRDWFTTRNGFELKWNYVLDYKKNREKKRSPREGGKFCSSWLKLIFNGNFINLSFENLEFLSLPVKNVSILSSASIVPCSLYWFVIFCRECIYCELCEKQNSIDSGKTGRILELFFNPEYVKNNAKLRNFSLGYFSMLRISMVYHWFIFRWPLSRTIPPFPFSSASHAVYRHSC